jgi:hypothetical protein
MTLAAAHLTVIEMKMVLRHKCNFPRPEPPASCEIVHCPTHGRVHKVGGFQGSTPGRDKFDAWLTHSSVLYLVIQRPLAGPVATMVFMWSEPDKQAMTAGTTVAEHVFGGIQLVHPLKKSRVEPHVASYANFPLICEDRRKPATVLRLLNL